MDVQPMPHNDAVTLTRHIINECKNDDLTILLTSIQLACKVTGSAVRKAGIAKMLGVAGNTNVQGEEVKKLDVFANDAFINSLTFTERLNVMVSEENDDPIIVPGHLRGKYSVAFDPLDGSSNIDCNVSIGSIFGIYKADEPSGTDKDILQAGKHLVAAGYGLYGSCTQIVLTTGKGVDVFTLDPALGEFMLTHHKVQIPQRGKIYSVNEGNHYLWDSRTQNYVNSVKSAEGGRKPYSLRYVGSMIADVHRTLLYGGIFLYPADKKNASGKLRLLYECNPMSFIVEQAGGRSIENNGGRILDIEPTDIHQRSPIIMGSTDDVNDYEKTM